MQTFVLFCLCSKRAPSFVREKKLFCRNLKNRNKIFMSRDRENLTQFRSHLQDQRIWQDFLDGGQKALGHTNQVFYNKRKPKSAHQKNQNQESDVLLSKNSNTLLMFMMNKIHWLFRRRQAFRGRLWEKEMDYDTLRVNMVCVWGRTSVAGPIESWQKECESCSQGERRQAEQCG